MKLEQFDYDLPAELIAQVPAPDRGASRMMMVDRSAGTFADASFADLPASLRPDDVLVLNNTRVFPARLIGRTETGAAVEIFLVRELSEGQWETLARPGKRLTAGKRIVFGDGLTATVVEKQDSGTVIVDLESEGPLDKQIDRYGRTPLPPYIHREGDGIDNDRERYQTVFAKERGAIAAPTAGLHFTPETIAKIGDRGITVVELTLHVGYGTFEPVRVDEIERHSVQPERYSMTAETADALNDARQHGRRIVAVGTTTTRALESNISEFGGFRSGAYSAELTILPGYTFRAVGALLTNFHLPKSSLLVLVSTFAGHELIMDAYRHAVEEKYRFYSYGDCMLIE